ncbi:VCBS domain-containing protein [Cyanobium sp. T1B-Tous]|uniref:beta strand repeat-containing protein n=1 Tax=Cyanobium sp. T1B-Tous TaxID=2823721 RepID=UPI0020CDB4CF|nr:VCBS domain-containing protein [Cyanobium sp. T1B-Tous]
MRVPINNDATNEPDETFSLTATNSGGTPVVGTATITDDGNGTIFNPDGSVNTTAPKDDDRPLTVSSVTVREDQGPALFTVTGASGQLVKLGLQSTGSNADSATINGTGADVGSIEYFDGTTWLPYTPDSFVVIPASGTTLQVRVAINLDALEESPETFYLAATNTGSQTALGTGTINNYAPPADAVTANAIEAGWSDNTTPVGSGAFGDLVTDSSLSLFSASFGSTTQFAPDTGTTTLTGAFGTLTFANDGAWSYAIDNTDPAVEALRLSSDTLTDTFTYTIKDAAGAQSTSSLNITIQGSNDKPQATPDYNVAKESLTAELNGASSYNANDPLGFEATGNVLGNDTDVDAGDDKTILGLSGTATGTVSGNTTVTTENASSSLSNDNGRTLRVFLNAAGTIPLLDSLNQQVSATITGTGANLSVSLSDASRLSIGTEIFLEEAANTYTSGGTVTSITEPSSTTVALTGTSGTVAVGMTVNGTGLATAPTVVAVTYDSNGIATSVTLSAAVSLVGDALTFSASAGTTIQGRYGDLELNVDGSYTYTPDVDNPALDEGQSASEIFNYTMQDAGGLTSSSTLTITVLGSGTNDPDAKSDTNTIDELGVSNASGYSSLISGNVLGGTGASAGDTTDTTPAGTGTLSVSGAKTSSAAGFTSPSSDSITVNGLYGTLTINSTTGAYTYTLDNSKQAVQALNVGDGLTEEFQYEVSNGPIPSSTPSSFKDVANLTITINGKNDAPILDLDPGDSGTTSTTNTFTEGGSPAALAIAAGINLSDVDNASYDQISIQFTTTGFADTGEELLIAGATSGGSIALNNIQAGSGSVVLGGVTYDYSISIATTTATINFTGAGGAELSSAAAEALLEALRYQNTSDNPTESDRVFTLTATDGNGAASAAATATVSVQGVNDPPSLDLDVSAPGTGFTNTFTVGGPAIGIADSDSLVSDVDSATMASATIVLINAKVGDSLSLVGSLPAGITAAVPSTATADGTLTLTLSGLASKADYEAAIESIRFAATGTNYTNRLLEVTVNDGSTNSNTALATLTVAPNNRPLTVSGTTVNEASPYVQFSVGGTIGQRVTLELQSGTASLGIDTANAGTGVPLQYLDGNSWVDYTPGTAITLTTPTLLVRTAVVNDSINEGGETLSLIARNDAGTAATGISTITDDGNGTIFNPDGSVNTTAPKDDDRPLTVSSVTVNEASPYATFTVTGAPGQLTSLALSGQNSDGANLSALEYWNGSAWTAYTSGNVPLDGTGSLLVRVGLTPEQDTPFDGPETFNLVATNTGGTAATGQATIKDDGTGDYFAPDNNTGTPALPLGVVLDDDRALTVSSPTVNEGSPYATFTVTGAPNQLVSLTLANGTSTGITGLEVFDPAANSGAGAWVPYTSGNVSLGSNGTLLVRTPLTPEQETNPDNGETFTLTATNTGGTAAIGTATIKDDGTGSIFLGNNNTATPNLPGDTDPNGPDYPAQLDDDRPLTVGNVAVNEGSPFAVFSVTGASGQFVKLSLDGASGNGTPDATGGAANLGTSPALQYLEGGIWKSYDANNPPAITSGTTLLVRVAIGAEQDTPFDGPETFDLVATNTGGTAASGTATITDDGTGDYFDTNNTSATSALPTGVALDDDTDDRPLSITSLTVNEGSPYVMFSVSGAAGQLVASLSQSDGSAKAGTDFVGALQYFDPIIDGGTWRDYQANTFLNLGNSGSLLVRAQLINDLIFEDAETFSLLARNTGGGEATGVATIVDNGTGIIFNSDGSINNIAGKDDDRPLPATTPIPAPQLQTLLCVEKEFEALGEPNFISWLTGGTASTDSVLNSLGIMGS